MFKIISTILLLVVSGTTLQADWDFEASETFAHLMDKNDPIAHTRNSFHIPKDPSGQPLSYFCSMSLGIMPAATEEIMEKELAVWAEDAVDARFRKERPWTKFHTRLNSSLAKIVGAKSAEVTTMNSTMVNANLMMATFYQPQPGRYKILIDAPTFPGNLYAVEQQLRLKGFNPEDALIIVSPRPGEEMVTMEDIYSVLEQEGEQIALVYISGVNHLTGLRADMEKITKEGHRFGCKVGFDLAHAVGNIELQLHDWEVDFAVWCTYKYLSSGPGGLGGIFIHEKHAQDPTLLRLAGWRGADGASQKAGSFIPQLGAEGWQLSSPPIFALVPLEASLKVFDEVGMPAVVEKSKRLTAYLEFLLEQIDSDRFEIVTPKDPTKRGSLITLKIVDRPDEVVQKLRSYGVVCDVRDPYFVRIAPAPLYNTYYDVWKLGAALKNILEKDGN